MRFCVLGSGSKGNCTVVASGDNAILIDAGFSGVETERRLQGIGFSLSDIKGILITHEHGDHVKGAGILSRKYQIPVLVNEATRAATGKTLEKLHSCHIFETGQPFTFENFQIHPFSISHDTADPVGFCISDGRYSLGYCTDTGMVSRLIHHHLAKCNGLVLECNHDLEMLRNSDYPPATQQRIRSKGGHLANPQTLEFLGDLLHSDLRHVVLAHISESNNCYNLVRKMVADFMLQRSEKFDVAITVAMQNSSGKMIDLSSLPSS